MLEIVSNKPQKATNYDRICLYVHGNTTTSAAAHTTTTTTTMTIVGIRQELTELVEQILLILEEFGHFGEHFGFGEKALRVALGDALF